MKDVSTPAPEVIEMKRMVVVLFVVVVLLCGLNIPLAAQSCPGKLAIGRIDFLNGERPNLQGCVYLAPSDTPFDYVVGCWFASGSYPASGNLVAPANVIATLTQNGTQTRTLAFQNPPCQVSPPFSNLAQPRQMRLVAATTTDACRRLLPLKAKSVSSPGVSI